MEWLDLRDWKGFDAFYPHVKDMDTRIQSVSIDSRTINCPHTLFVALRGRNTDGHQHLQSAANAGATFGLVCKDFTAPIKGMSLLKVDSPLSAMQEIAALYRRQRQAKIIVIAGSYGKTMVKDLLDRILSRSFQVAASPGSFNSQIGVALSLFSIENRHAIALIEAGFSHPGEMARHQMMVKPDFGILTHLGKKHQVTLGDLQQCAVECASLLREVSSQNWILVPEDPVWVPITGKREHKWSEASETLPYIENKGSTFQISFPGLSPRLIRLRHKQSYICDLFNITAKAAWLLGARAEDILEELELYHTEPIRTEIWKLPSGPSFINDTYCSDPLSVNVALKHFDIINQSGRKIVVFGGMRKASTAESAQIENTLRKAPVDEVHLIGKTLFLEDPLSVRLHEHSSLQEALQTVSKTLQPNDTVLIKGPTKIALDDLMHHFNGSACNNICFINLAAIHTNIQSLRKKLGEEKRIMVMVKASAYGTDDIQMAKFLATCGIDILGVSYVEEGVALRRKGVEQDIFVINTAPYEADRLVDWNLQSGVDSVDMVHTLQTAALRQEKKLKVHLHINTGMGRFGCAPKDALAIAKEILGSSNLLLDGIMTHLASADNPAHDAFTCEQIATFDKTIAELESAGIALHWRHAANSSGTLRFSLDQYNMVRLGLAVYGLYASAATSQDLDLRLALTLQSRLVGIQEVCQGETVSYNRSYTIRRPKERIGVLPIGYFDGLHRSYSGKGAVMIRGQKAPMIGNICMDYMMIDLTDIPDAQRGDPVLIFGEDEYGQYVSPEELAAQGQSIIHELITCLGPRIQRVFIYEEAKKSR